MKSSIKIDFLDRGTGVGLEPVIRIELIKSEDPRDTLIQVLFESLRDTSFLQFSHSNQKHVATKEGLPDMEKQILIHKQDPKAGVNVHNNSIAFRKFLDEKKINWSPNEHFTLIHDQVDLFDLGEKYQKSFEEATK